MSHSLERERRSHADYVPAGPWLQTSTGRKVSLREPRVEDISIRDIAAHLAKLCRFSGATDLFFSVAQHCVLVSEMFVSPVEATYALLHDAHEAYIGDISSPMKAALVVDGHLDRVALMADRFDHVIRLAVGINPEMPYGLEQFLHHADRVQLATELRDLVPGNTKGWGPLPDPRPRPIVPLRWDKAEELFLRRWRELCALTGIDPKGDRAIPGFDFPKGVSP